MTVTETSSAERLAGERRPTHASFGQLGWWLAVLALALASLEELAGLRVGYLGLGLAVTMTLLPVLVHKAFDRREIGLLVASLLVCVPAGLVLALGSDTGDIPRSSNWWTALSLPIGAAMTVITVRYGVRLIGVRATALAYATGVLLNTLLGEVALAEPQWLKTHMAWPIAVLLLAAAYDARRVLWEWTALGLCLVIAVASEYRGLVAFLGIAGAMTLIRRRHAAPNPSRISTARVVLAASAVGFIAYQALSWAAVTGYFGIDVAVKSQEQMIVGGSLIQGARVETPATLALMAHRPFGYGPGFVPSSREASIVESAIPAVSVSDGIRTHIREYVLGHPVRLHSLAGDLWFLFGLAGVLACAVLVYSLFIAGRSWYFGQGTRLLSGTLLIWTAWDVLYSPVYSNLMFAMFAVTLLLPTTDRECALGASTRVRRGGRRQGAFGTVRR